MEARARMAAHKLQILLIFYTNDKYIVKSQRITELTIIFLKAVRGVQYEWFRSFCM